MTRNELLSEAKNILASIDYSKYSGDPEERLMDIHSDICSELEERHKGFSIDENLLYNVVNDAIYNE